jgi:hypothetical protein
LARIDYCCHFLFGEELQPGTNVIIFLTSPKKIGVFAQTTASFCKKMIITLIFENNAIFSPKIGKNRRKLLS